MPVASRAAVMLAGILGGSGTHVVQIIIGTVLAALVNPDLCISLRRQ
jgi:hypothetical protein